MVQFRRNCRLQHLHQRDHLIHLVLQRRTRHEQDSIRVFAQMDNILCTACFCVFDVVGFIDNHHVKFESLIYLQITGRFKIRDRNTAIFLPILKSVHAPCTMNLCHAEFALFCNLLAPVGHNAGRGNNNKMGCTCVPQ